MAHRKFQYQEREMNPVAMADEAGVADRVLQRCKRAGTHAYSGGKWKRVKIHAIS